MSKFIPKSRLNKQVLQRNNLLPNDYWESRPTKEDKKEQKKYQEEMSFKEREKQRIESIPLEQVSFRDLYQFPFHQAKYGSWVYDANSNFIFQFQFNNKETQQKTIDVLNGDFVSDKDNKFIHKDGMIYLDKDGELKEVILIRGWGNLTGGGSYNLDGEYAGKIQDTLAEYIVQKLNKEL
jgi:hypothetical protein